MAEVKVLPLPLAARVAELESRVEGIEYLIADMRAEMGLPSITAPDAARLVAEERYRPFTRPPSNPERNP